MVTPTAFSWQDGDGKVTKQILSGQGGTLRVSYGKMRGLHSGIWKIEARPKGDVYIMERSSARALKISLHQSGDWRIQWIVNPGSPQPGDGKYFADLLGSRIIDQWERPPALGGMFSLGISISTFAEDVTDRAANPPNDAFWLDPPRGREEGQIIVGFMPPAGKPLAVPGFTPIGVLGTGTRDAVVVLARMTEMSAQGAAVVAEERQRLRTALRSTGALQPGTKRRAIMNGHMPDTGYRMIWDLSI